MISCLIRSHPTLTSCPSANLCRTSSRRCDWDSHEVPFTTLSPHTGSGGLRCWSFPSDTAGYSACRRIRSSGWLFDLGCAGCIISLFRIASPALRRIDLPESGHLSWTKPPEFDLHYSPQFLSVRDSSSCHVSRYRFERPQGSAHKCDVAGKSLVQTKHSGHRSALQDGKLSGETGVQHRCRYVMNQSCEGTLEGAQGPG